MYFELVREIGDVETIAVVRLASGRTRRAEVPWYEAHGVGRVRMKIKRFLD